MVKILKVTDICCEVKEENKSALSFFKKIGYKEIEFDEEYKEFILKISL